MTSTTTKRCLLTNMDMKQTLQLRGELKLHLNSFTVRVFDSRVEKRMGSWYNHSDPFHFVFIGMYIW